MFNICPILIYTGLQQKCDILTSPVCEFFFFFFKSCLLEHKGGVGILSQTLSHLIMECEPTFSLSGNVLDMD